jgi:hypothetical protein
MGSFITTFHSFLLFYIAFPSRLLQCPSSFLVKSPVLGEFISFVYVFVFTGTICKRLAATFIPLHPYIQPISWLQLQVR